MISDEMRELLSAYVDDELRDSDAARVEDMTKRDPELRREIESYRKLRRKLKAWDDEEHAGEPSPAMAEKALARVRKYAAHTERMARARAWNVFYHPVAVAACLLVAAGLGLALAARTARETSPERTELVLTPAQPMESHALDGSVLKEHRSADLTELERMNDLYDILDLDTRIVDGVVMSDKALDQLEQWRREDLVFERIKRRLAAHAKERPAPRRTGTWNTFVMTAVAAYEPTAAPYAGMVLLSQPKRVRSRLPEVGVLPPEAAVVEKVAEDRTFIKVEKGTLARLALLGEVFTSKKNGRARIVGATSWIRSSEIVPMVWADRRPVPSALDNLSLRSVVLGPKARKRVLAAGVRDEAFLQWLGSTYKRPLGDAFKARAKTREREVGKLMRLLDADSEVSGFAVVGADDQVLGIELFGSHSLMVAFAPKLLRGYLLEAGPRGIKLKTRKTGVAGPSVQTTRHLLDTLPEQARFEEVQTGSTEDWPQELQRVNLMSPGKKIRGHGLLHKGQPVHLTIFGD